MDLLRTPGLLAGVGLASTLDQVVLHQLLHWHAFLTAPGRGGELVSDGIFHLFGTAVLVAGLVLLMRRRAELAAGWRRRSAGWVLVGLGGFNLYDSFVQHKLLGLHQVREGVEDLLPYDVGFTLVALVALLAGLALLRAAPAPRP